jgi:hypothetical protein
MDEEYNSTVKPISTSNPWADFEPISASRVDNINNQRGISSPITNTNPNNVYDKQPDITTTVPDINTKQPPG